MGCIGFLFYCWNAVFNPPKIKALVIAILCGLAGLAFFIAIPFVPDSGYAFSVFGFCCWAYSFWYGCVWTIKFCRDADIKLRAERDRLNPLRQAQVQQPAQKYNPDSSSLFVPPQRNK